MAARNIAAQWSSTYFGFVYINPLSMYRVDDSFDLLDALAAFNDGHLDGLQDVRVNIGLESILLGSTPSRHCNLASGFDALHWKTDRLNSAAESQSKIQSN